MFRWDKAANIFHLSQPFSHYSKNDVSFVFQENSKYREKAHKYTAGYCVDGIYIDALLAGYGFVESDSWLKINFTIRVSVWQNIKMAPLMFCFQYATSCFPNQFFYMSLTYKDIKRGLNVRPVQKGVLPGDYLTDWRCETANRF